jgi:YHS domain-containing protein
MKVMCNQCGMILDLMKSQSFAVEEGDHLKSFYFCSEEHMSQYVQRKGMKSGTD